MLTRLLQIYSVLFAFAAATSGQSLLGVSSVKADRSLVCPAGITEANVTVQVYFSNSDSRVKDGTVAVSLSIYSAKPTGNAVSISKAAKVKLNHSPAIASFTVACTPDTAPGEIVLYASLDETPNDIRVEPFTPGSLGRVKIEAATKQQM